MVTQMVTQTDFPMVTHWDFHSQMVITMDFHLEILMGIRSGFPMDFQMVIQMVTLTVILTQTD